MTAGLQRGRFNNRAGERQRNESKKQMLLSGLRITGPRTSTGLELTRERQREGEERDGWGKSQKLDGRRENERRQVFRMGKRRIKNE